MVLVTVTLSDPSIPNHPIFTTLHYASTVYAVTLSVCLPACLPACLSVCLSQVGSFTKTAKIMQTMSYGNPKILVFWCQRS